MIKSSAVLSSLSLLVAFQAPHSGDVGSFDALKEEQMFIEYTATSGEAALKVAAESEHQLRRVSVRGPGGESMLELYAEDRRGVALQGLVLETYESSLSQLLRTFPEGEYGLRAKGVSGGSAFGSALLSHELPAVPIILRPRAGAAAVDPCLTVTWAADSGAAAYRVGLEQGDSDNIVVELPPERTSFTVPEGVLRSNELTQLEVGTVGANGNITLVEFTFTTR